MKQNKRIPKYKLDKIQSGKNTNETKWKMTIYKWDEIQNIKIQRQQNANIDIGHVGPGFHIENQDHEGMG